MRVVTLLPSATEIVHAVGMGERQVGRSHECDHPEEVRRLPACTEARHGPDGTSYAIDERLRALLQEGLSVYRVDAVRLEALRPDVIVTQDQCDVCAASLEDVREAVAALLDPAPALVSLEARTLDGIWDDVIRVGQALDASREARAVVSRGRERTAAVADRAGRAAERPRVALVEWLDPLMSAGNWMPELVRMAGGEPLFGEVGSHSPWLDPGELVAADPDVVVAVPCGFGLSRTLSEVSSLWGIPGFRDTTAVRERRVFAADGNALFNRPGPRIVESLEVLAEMLHPELFPPRWEGRRWSRIGHAA